MLAACVDHLWQTLLFCAAISLIAWLTRRNSAHLRRWLWRLAALKFLLPVALLVAIGGWIGFPTEYTHVPTAPSFLARVAALTAWFAPARAAGLGGTALGTALAIALVVAGGSARWISSRLRAEDVNADAEAARQRIDVDAEPPGAGFFKGAFITTCKTVDNHTQNVFAKIDVKTRGGATLFAIERGLCGPPLFR